MPAKAAVRVWGRNMMMVPLPGAGCFRASYPAAGWTRVACVAPPRVWFPPRTRGPIDPAVIGNGNDYGIDVSPLTMLGAIGSFTSVSGVKAITSCPPRFAKGNTCGTHGYGSNVYSIQLNSNNFSTAVCAKQIDCVGWEQFVYTNQPKDYGGGGNLIIQDWLLSTASHKIACPRNAGWSRSGDDCVRNAPYAVLVPNVPIADLDQLGLSGSATPSGDSAFLAVDGYVYGMKNAQHDGITDLSQHWTGAEFNILGNGGGTRAVFNAGSTVTIGLEAITGYNTVPRCRGNAGTTAEENNLSFVAAPANPPKQQYPSIAFTESNAASGNAPSCVAVPGL